ncbi:MAG: sigma-70 family RNA polymerase sigma factor [Verrucomicrobiota bacterium]
MNLGTATFATTHWSVVLAAQAAHTPQAAKALEKLCRTYWYPLYAYVRREGSSALDAQDLTQEFFARLLEKNYLGQVAREKGKFRSFLLAALRHFLADQRDRARAVKRGGGADCISLDAQTAEERYRLEPADELNPEKIYERRWAMTLLDQVLRHLEAEFAATGKRPLFEHLKVFLLDEKGVGSYAETAARLEMTEGALRVAVHRLRQRYGELFRNEIAHTVARPDEIEEEVRHLLRVLSG